MITIEDKRLIVNFLNIDTLNHYEYFELITNQDWNIIIDTLRRIEEKSEYFPEDTNFIGDITHALLNYDPEETILAAIEAIKFLNKDEKENQG